MNVRQEIQRAKRLRESGDFLSWIIACQMENRIREHLRALVAANGLTDELRYRYTQLRKT